MRNFCLIWITGKNLLKGLATQRPDSELRNPVGFEDDMYITIVHYT